MRLIEQQTADHGFLPPGRARRASLVAHLAEIRGGVDYAREQAVTSCPHPHPGPLQNAWVRGWTHAAVSHFLRDANDFQMFHGKRWGPHGPAGRARAPWRAVEWLALVEVRPVLAGNAIALLLNRPHSAIRQKAWRGGLTRQLENVAPAKSVTT